LVEKKRSDSFFSIIRIRHVYRKSASFSLRKSLNYIVCSKGVRVSQGATGTNVSGGASAQEYFAGHSHVLKKS
jgi:hypothetical protein